MMTTQATLQIQIFILKKRKRKTFDQKIYVEPKMREFEKKSPCNNI
jgi:hypothetical protein